jgi:hypothetical protein
MQERQDVAGDAGTAEDRSTRRAPWRAGNGVVCG